MCIDINDIDSLKSLVDEIKERHGDKISVEALTLVIKVDGWDMKVFNYESGAAYEIE